MTAWPADGERHDYAKRAPGGSLRRDLAPPEGAELGKMLQNDARGQLPKRFQTSCSGVSKLARIPQITCPSTDDRRII